MEDMQENVDRIRKMKRRERKTALDKDFPRPEQKPSSSSPRTDELETSPEFGLAWDNPGEATRGSWPYY